MEIKLCPMNMEGEKYRLYASSFDFNSYSHYCYSLFGYKPVYDFALNSFGGIRDKEYLSA